MATTAKASRRTRQTSCSRCRAHERLDTMSAELGGESKKRSRDGEGVEKEQNKVVADSDLDEASRNRLQSGTVNEAM